MSLKKWRARPLLGAFTLALLGSSGLVATSNVALAQQQNASQIEVPPAAQPSEGFADLVAAVKPAVVSIMVEGTGGEPRRGERRGFPELPDGHPFQDFFDQFGDRFGSPGEEIEPRRFMAAGSGFVISEDGYIVTNNHVVNNADEVTILFDDGEERMAEVIGTDERTDLAVLKVDAENLPFVAFEQDPEDTRIGDWVVAVGNPFGLGGTVTVGVISAIGRELGGPSHADFLQIDAAVNTGNSGGPTFNTDGEVVGVNTAIYSPTGGNVGIAFAVPAATVEQVVEQLIDTGVVTRGYLGVSIQDVTEDIASSLGLDEAQGAIVNEPAEDSPAQEAGLESGDVITAVDGEPIEDALDLSRTIASTPPGTEVELTVWRDGSERQISVTLDVLTDDDETQGQPLPPADVGPMDSMYGLSLLQDEDEGLLVAEVEANSVAAEQGLRPGDVILEVNNEEVTTVEAFEEAVEAAEDAGREAVLVKAGRDGNNRFLTLPLEQ
ncbi:MAG TPA: Do family serine endopeptidase [Devosia sp.]|jgi:serine protease Do|nr:Do family serine endopeptidase [Devosia sp.]